MTNGNLSGADTTGSRHNLRGIILMVGSMAGFAIEDMFIKWTAANMPTGQILLILGLGGVPIFMSLARRDGRHTFTRAALHPMVIWRNTGEMIGTAGFVTAIATLPLSTATALFQAMPLFVTMGAALFLGEQVGWRRWTAICIGFFGVLMIIRPGVEGFRPEALWSLLAVVGLGIRDLAVRRIPPAISTMQLASWGYIAVAVLGAGMLAFSGGVVMPNAVQAGYLAAALVFSVTAYWALTQATRLGEISVVTPFRYSRLIFGMLIGIFVFSEHPDLWTLIGAALIIASGLYTFAREQARKRALHITVTAG